MLSSARLDKKKNQIQIACKIIKLVERVVRALLCQVGQKKTIEQKKIQMKIECKIIALARVVGALL